MWPGYVTLWRQPVPVCRGIQPIVDEYFSSLGPSVTETVCSPGMTEIFDSGCHITSTIIQSSCSDKPWQTLSWSGGRRRTRQKPKSDVAEPRTRQAFWLWYPNPGPTTCWSTEFVLPVTQCCHLGYILCVSGHWADWHTLHTEAAAIQLHEYNHGHIHRTAE